MRNLMPVLTVWAFLISVHVNAQVAVNNDNSAPDPSAMLDVKSTSTGMLVPRMTAGERDLISSPADGLLVYVTSDSSFYYFHGSGWQKIVAGADDDWVISGANMYSNVSGNVGIGLTNPQNLLHVANLSTGASVARFETPSETCIELKGGTRTWALVSDNSPDVFRIRDLTSGGGTSDHFAIDAAGNVGIGLTAPTSKLDVNGQVRIRGGNPGMYKVLTSDANGLGSWGPNRSLTFPDGVFPMQPVTWIFFSGNYIVPPGKNLYITNIYNQFTTAPIIIDGQQVFYGNENIANFNTLETPIIANPYMTISSGNPNVSFNGFLVDATVQAIVTSSSINVMPNTAFVVLGLYAGTSQRALQVNGITVYFGYGNYCNGSQPYRPPRMPVVAGPNQTITFNGGVINGYFINL
ncbi:MAG: hypothetical protein JXA03_03245 [Bacteroidales bacterium]|nr:hypothetical protein [Bacteroidales bacterium]